MGEDTCQAGDRQKREWDVDDTGELGGEVEFQIGNLMCWRAFRWEFKGSWTCAIPPKNTLQQK